MILRDEDQAIGDQVIRATSDDYEDFEMVVTEVSRWAIEHGTTANRQTIFEKLCEVITEGYVGSYLYSHESAKFESVGCLLEDLDELWFYVTAKGKAYATELGGTDA